VQDAAKAFKDFVRVVGGVLLVVFLFGIIPPPSLKLDESGWIPHNKIVSVQLRPLAWVPGEYRTCYSTVLPSPSSLKENEVTSSECDPAGDYHNLDVRFWGPIDRPRTTTWNCQRKGSLLGEGTSLSCEVTDSVERGKNEEQPSERVPVRRNGPARGTYVSIDHYSSQDAYESVAAEFKQQCLSVPVIETDQNTSVSPQAKAYWVFYWGARMEVYRPNTPSLINGGGVRVYAGRGPLQSLVKTACATIGADAAAH
jgi:hypothetical protein